VTSQHSKKNFEIMVNPDVNGYTTWQWLRICLWILKFENLFICHLWHNSNVRREYSRLGRKDKP